MLCCSAMNEQTYIDIDIQAQMLYLWELGVCVQHTAVSTALLGVGQLQGSFKTPLGLHYVRAKIGNDAPVNAVFVGRRQTGEIYTPQLREQSKDRDWILTRIMWLCGLEPGKNRLGNCDTFRRYIYIHGCPDDARMGTPGSHGCVRMHNHELIELFNRIKVGVRVFIH